MFLSRRWPFEGGGGPREGKRSRQEREQGGMEWKVPGLVCGGEGLGWFLNHVYLDLNSRYSSSKS